MREEALARLAGVTVQQLVQIRKAKLYQDEHWIRKGSGFDYTPAGVSAVMEDAQRGSVGRERAEPIPDVVPEVDRGVSVNVERLDVMIIRTCPNPTWVRVKLPDGSRADCRVQNNRHLHPLMTLKGCWKEADGRMVYPGRCVL